MLFMVNPPKRKKSRKRRTAKQKAATKKMIAARKAKMGGKKKRVRRKTRTTHSGGTMARRKRSRKRTTARRRKSTVKRRSPVTTLARRKVYMTNPRHKRRHRVRRHRNPGIVEMIKQSAIDAGATLVGGAAARTASGLLPLPSTGLAGVASGLAVAAAVRFAAQKVVSYDTARFIGAGAMQVPIKNLITTFIPQAGAFLGDYDSIGAYRGGVGDYLNPMPSNMAGAEEESFVEVGSY